MAVSFRDKREQGAPASALLASARSLLSGPRRWRQGKSRTWLERDKSESSFQTRLSLLRASRQMGSFEYFQSKESEKVGIAFNRPPASVGVLIQNRELNLFHSTCVRWRGAGVINHPIGGLVATHLRGTQKNHYVVRKLLHPWLVEKQQIARLGHPAITADEFGIETFETARVCKLGKGPIRQLAVFVGAKAGAEELFSKRALLERVTRNIGSDRGISRPHLLQPGAIVTSQAFAPGKAHQTGAVSLFCVPLFAQVVKLALSNQGEPAAKVLAIHKALQFSRGRDAVV